MFNYDYFSDSAFREAMEELSLEEGEQFIIPSSVTALRITAPEALTDLAYFKNLHSLHIYCAELDNLEEIKMLKHLTELLLFDSSINDLSALWDMEQLTSLFTDQFCDIAPVSRLRNLNTLGIMHGYLSDLTHLNNLTKLNDLILQVCNLHNIEFIQSMKNLRLVNITMNKVSDIRPLEGLTNLEVVELWENQIRDLSPLKDLEQIIELDISSNPINWEYCDLSDLKCLPGLKIIGLFDLSITPEQIIKAQNLREVYLGGKKCSDISFLTNHPGIESVGLVGSSVRDISYLTGLPNLKELWISGNEEIEDYTPIHLLRSRGIEVHTDGWTLDDDFIELHIHTIHSKKGSVIQPESLADWMSKVDVKAVAITDYNTLDAFPEAGHFLGIDNIKTIFGMETSTEKGHITLLAKDQDGLECLYSLEAGLSGEDDIIEEKDLLAQRKGLLLGSGDEYGELVQAIEKGNTWKELKSIAKKFDYLELMPVFNRDVVETIIDLGEKLDIPVCAVSDARFLRREDEVLLRKLNNTKIEAPRYLRDYQGKRSSFSYLDQDIQDKIIIDGPNRVLGMIEDVKL